LLAIVLLFTTSFEATAQQTRGMGLSSTGSEKRVALVIGNSRYESAPLRNPVNDANLVAATLREIGFDVISRTDVNLREMQLAVREFSRKIQNGSVGLFYYAGHGMQSGGRNFLIPVSAQIEVEGDVVLEALDLNSVLEQMGMAQNRLNIVILDACRNNPFTRSFRSGAQGLAQVNAPAGTFIAYATAPGQTASDGKGGFQTRACAGQAKEQRRANPLGRFFARRLFLFRGRHRRGCQRRTAAVTCDNSAARLHPTCDHSAARFDSHSLHRCQPGVD
jgi:uncharacterized caspase-like protein